MTSLFSTDYYKDVVSSDLDKEIWRAIRVGDAVDVLREDGTVSGTLFEEIGRALQAVAHRARFTLKGMVEFLIGEAISDRVDLGELADAAWENTQAAL